MVVFVVAILSVFVHHIVLYVVVVGIVVGGRVAVVVVAVHAVLILRIGDLRYVGEGGHGRTGLNGGHDVDANACSRFDGRADEIAHPLGRAEEAPAVEIVVAQGQSRRQVIGDLDVLRGDGSLVDHTDLEFDVAADGSGYIREKGSFHQGQIEHIEEDFGGIVVILIASL